MVSLIREMYQLTYEDVLNQLLNHYLQGGAPDNIYADDVNNF
jgi:hypothetical protein